MPVLSYVHHFNAEQCQAYIHTLPGSFSFPVQSRGEPTLVTAGPPTDGPLPQCSHSLRTYAGQSRCCVTRP
jgi:hypothetical protein